MMKKCKMMGRWGYIPYIKGCNQVLETYQYSNNNAKHYVLWSGGFDSSVLLYELLLAYGEENVVAISYKYPWLVPEKIKQEELHREAFKSLLKIRNNSIANFQHVEFEITQKSINGGLLNPYSHLGLPQSIAWLLMAPIYVEEDAYLYDGGIKNDDLTLITHEYQSLIDSINKIINKNIHVRQPYLLLTKDQIIEKALLQYGIYDTSWYCETPNANGTPCGHCVCCKTHISSLIHLYIDSSGFTRVKAKEKLNEIINSNEYYKNIIMELCEDKFPTINLVDDDKSKEDNKDSNIDITDDKSKKESEIYNE